MEIIEVYKTICIMMDGNFISRKRIGGIVALSFLQFGNLSGQERPNIVMILADDMGYSNPGKSYDWFVSTSSWDRMDVRRSF